MERFRPGPEDLHDINIATIDSPVSEIENSENAEIVVPEFPQEEIDNRWNYDIGHIDHP